jgi:hypothetical protein
MAKTKEWIRLNKNVITPRFNPRFNPSDFWFVQFNECGCGGSLDFVLDEFLSGQIAAEAADELGLDNLNGLPTEAFESKRTAILNQCLRTGRASSGDYDWSIWHISYD